MKISPFPMIWRSRRSTTSREPKPAPPVRETTEARLEQLMDRHGRLVYGTAKKMLGHTQDAQDASQEVFLRLYRSLHRLAPSRSLEPWLYRVTVNVCHDLYRRRPREAALDPEEPIRLASGDDPEAESAAREEQEILNQGLATLAEKERAALVLRDLRGLSTEEVAAILGSTPQTVRSQISRARRKLDAYRQSRHRGPHPGARS